MRLLLQASIGIGTLTLILSSLVELVLEDGRPIGGLIGAGGAAFGIASAIALYVVDLVYRLSSSVIRRRESSRWLDRAIETRPSRRDNGVEKKEHPVAAEATRNDA